MAFQLKQSGSEQSQEVEQEYQEDTQEVSMDFDDTNCIANKDLPMLRSLGVAIEDPPTVRQSECLFFGDKIVYTFSGELGAICKKSYGVVGAVNYKNFVDVYKRFRDRPVQIVKDGSALVLSSGSVEVQIPIDDILSLDFNCVTQPDEDKWVTLSKDYERSLKSCASVVRTTDKDDVLSSIAIEQDSVTGGSTAEIIRHYIISPFDKRFLVRAKSLLKVLKKLEGASIKMQLVDKWLYVSNTGGALRYCVPVYEDEYVDVDEYFQPLANKIVFPKVEMLDALDTCMGVVKGGEKITVKLDSVARVCKLRGKSADKNDRSGFSFFKADVAMDSPVTMEFTIDPSVLYKVVAKYQECTINVDGGIRINTPEISYAISIERA